MWELEFFRMLGEQAYLFGVRNPDLWLMIQLYRYSRSLAPKAIKKNPLTHTESNSAMILGNNFLTSNFQSTCTVARVHQLSRRGRKDYFCQLVAPSERNNRGTRGTHTHTHIQAAVGRQNSNWTRWISRRHSGTTERNFSSVSECKLLCPIYSLCLYISLSVYGMSKLDYSERTTIWLYIFEGAKGERLMATMCREEGRVCWWPCY